MKEEKKQLITMILGITFVIVLFIAIVSFVLIDWKSPFVQYICKGAIAGAGILGGTHLASDSIILATGSKKLGYTNKEILKNLPRDVSHDLPYHGISTSIGAGIGALVGSIIWFLA